MSGRRSAAMDRALALLLAGASYRDAARMAGVSVAGLVSAAGLAGVPKRRAGRRVKAVAPATQGS